MHGVIHQVRTRTRPPRYIVIVKLLHVLHCIRQPTYVATYVRSTILMYIPASRMHHEHAAISAIVVRTRNKGSLARSIARTPSELSDVGSSLLSFGDI